MSATSATPKLIAYSNDYGVPKQGFGPYNTIIVAFMYPGTGPGTLKWGPTATFWSGGKEVNKVAWLVENQPDLQVAVSLGGADWTSKSWQGLIGHETAVAASLAQLLQAVGVEPRKVGVDLDYEDDAGVFDSYPFPYDGVTLLGELSKAFKGAGFAFVSHAPQAPYVGCGVSVSGGECAAPRVPGYLLLMEKYGEWIDFLNVQFYNNPPFNDISAVKPLFEKLVAGGSVQFDASTEVKYKIPASKLMLGKPATQGDAGSGYSSPSDVESALEGLGPAVGGFMSWKLASDAENGFAMGEAAAQGLGLPEVE